jgi:hypothetical protein
MSHTHRGHPRGILVRLLERLRTLERELKQLRHRVEEKSQRFRLLLDQAIDDAEPPP